MTLQQWARLPDGCRCDYVTINMMATLMGMSETQFIQMLAGGATIKLSTGTAAFLGEYANLAAAQAAHPTATSGQYFLNNETNSVWYWNDGFNPAGYHNANIRAADYNALTQAQKDGQRWNIQP
jgi:hypothetical protein